MTEKTKKRAAALIYVAYIGMVVCLCWLALRAIPLVLPFLLALILSALLNPLVRFLHRKLHINQKAVSVSIMALLYILIGLLIALAATQAVVVLQGLVTRAPDYYRDVIVPMLTEMGTQLDQWIENLSPAWSASFDALQRSLSSTLGEQVASFSGKGVTFLSRVVGSIPGFLIALVFTVLLSFFISAQYDKVTAFFRKILPPKATDIYHEMTRLLRGTVFKYIRAVIILMLCTFVELTIGFLILGVSNPVLKAAGVAIFDALPVFGTGGIMIPWVLAELLLQDFGLAWQLAVLYAIVTVIRNVIEPKVVGDQLGLNPIVSLISIYLGYKLLGVIGMIFFPILAQILITVFDSQMIRTLSESGGRKESNDAPPDGAGRPPDG